MLGTLRYFFELHPLVNEGSFEVRARRLIEKLDVSAGFIPRSAPIAPHAEEDFRQQTQG